MFYVRFGDPSRGVQQRRRQEGVRSKIGGCARSLKNVVAFWEPTCGGCMRPTRKQQCKKRLTKVSPNKNAVFVMNTPDTDSGGLAGAGSAVTCSSEATYTCSARTMSQNTACMRCNTLFEPLQGQYHILISLEFVSFTVRPTSIAEPEHSRVSFKSNGDW